HTRSKRDWSSDVCSSDLYYFTNLNVVSTIRNYLKYVNGEIYMRQRFLKSGWQSLVAILIFVLLWEISVRIFAVEEWLLPAPSVIVLELFTVWPTFYPHLISTLILTMIGF